MASLYNEVGSDNEAKPLIEQPRVSKKRWSILLTSALIIMSNSAAGIPWTVTPDILSGYYNVSSEVVQVSKNFNILTPPVMSILGTFILSQFGIRISLLITALLGALGTCIRLGGLSRSGFTYIVIGQFILSLGTTFCLIASPQIAAVWFPGNERTFATSFGTVMNTLGVAIGFLMSTCMFPESSNVSEIYESNRNVLVTHAAFCVLFFALAVLLVRDEPAVYPSVSQSSRGGYNDNHKIKTYLISVGEILSNKEYLIIGIAYSIHCVVTFSSSVLLYEIIKEQSENRIHIKNGNGWIGFFSSFVSIGGAFVSSYMLDKKKEFKRVATLILMLSTLSSTLFAIAVYIRSNVYILAASFTILMICSIPYCASGLDHIADIAYPFPEACSLMLPLIFVYGGFVTAKYAMQSIIIKDHQFIIAVALTAMEATTLMLSFFANGDSGRILALSQEMDRYHINPSDL